MKIILFITSRSTFFFIVQCSDLLLFAQGHIPKRTLSRVYFQSNKNTVRGSAARAQRPINNPRNHK